MIYAAENALYGAGIDIGQADGWMDSTLRSAIRQFQNRHGELAVNGTLDAATLEALGIDYAPAMAISENHVGSAKAARLALNLPGDSVPAARPQAVSKIRPVTESTPQIIARAPAAKPAPEVPAPPTTAVQPETAVEARPQQPDTAAVVASAEPADADEQAPSPEERDVQIIAQARPATPVTPVTPAAEPDPISQLPTEPTSAGPASTHSVDAEPTPVDESMPAATQTPAAASVAPAPAAREPRESRGGFLASLFDFLFGWLI
ncbi:MAG: peptidoglycan-binding protein [Pseudomonadota bacterium]|nr:peptidoglycan-binding protein [Pseudomonadota bacterium]